MCDVRPFCGLRYPVESADLSSLITPPYDVISPEERLLFYRKHPHNIIRLEYATEEAGDTPANNRYTRSAVTLKEWLNAKVLVREDQPAYYVIEHRFPYQDNVKSRWGLMARVKLEEFGKGQIKAHEKTIKEHSLDRFNLLKACRANFSPIMGMIATENGELVSLLKSLAKGDPGTEAVDSYGVSYRLWVVTGAKEIEEVSRFFVDKPIYIADGHHRYETALRYRKESRSNGGEDDPDNFIMISLMDAQDPGLVMLPTHRLVRGLGHKSDTQLEDSLSPVLSVETRHAPSESIVESVQGWLRLLEERAGQDSVFGVYGLCGQKFCVSKLRSGAEIDRLIHAEDHPAWKSLDVDLLHRVVLKTALGLDTPEKEKAHLEFIRDGVEAVSRVDSGEYQLAFFLNPAPVSIVIDAADAGRRLPQKTTYFYPKTPAGLVINPLW